MPENLSPAPLEQTALQDIAEHITKQTLIPFLGAGASYPTYPLATQLCEGMVKHFGTKFPYDDNTHDILTASEFFLLKSDQESVFEWLRQQLNPKQQIQSLHRFLAQNKFKIIMTTNYDTLIETALKEEGKHFSVFHYLLTNIEANNCWSHQYFQKVSDKYEVSAAKSLSVDGFNSKLVTILKEEEGMAVIKIHGSWHEDEESYVISFSHYEEFLFRMLRNTVLPPDLLKYLKRRRFLFLGYGLGDWNLRLMLKTLREQRGDIRSWAVQKQITSVKKSIWEDYKITLIDSDLEDFVKQLEAILP